MHTFHKIQQGEEGKWIDFSMSHNGESILILGGGIHDAFILDHKFQSTKLLPTYDYEIPQNNDSPFDWASAVSGDGETVVVSNYTIQYPHQFPTSLKLKKNILIILGKYCENPVVVSQNCVQGAPHYDPETVVCANDGQHDEAYCSYDVGPTACAYCGLTPPPSSTADSLTDVSNDYGWEKIHNEGHISYDERFGSSLALSYDGKVLVVGAGYHDTCLLKNDYDCLFFDELLSDAQLTVLTLGWNSTTWNSGITPAHINVYWAELETEDRNSLIDLNYTEDNWDNAESDYVGSVQRYELRDSVEWMPTGDKITGDNLYDQLGHFPLDITDDGNRILVGGGENGFASVYDWDEKNSWQLIRRFSFECDGWAADICDLSGIGTDENLDDPQFGNTKTFMSRDGKIIAIGDHTYDPERQEGIEGDLQGAIYFFKWTTEFIQFAETLVGPENESYFGYSFSMSDDGELLVVTDYSDSKVYLYKLNTQKTAYERDIIIQDDYSYSLSLSRDGEKLITFRESESLVNIYQFA